MDSKDTKIALPVGTTLDRFIMRKQEDFPFATGELSQLLRDIALASKIVNREINRAGLMDISGASLSAIVTVAEAVPMPYSDDAEMFRMTVSPTSATESSMAAMGTVTVASPALNVTEPERVV